MIGWVIRVESDADMIDVQEDGYVPGAMSTEITIKLGEAAAIMPGQRVHVIIEKVD